MSKKLRHLTEASCFLLAYGMFRMLPLDAASALGGKIGRTIGPRIKKQNRYARRNLEIAFPEKTAEEREKILHGMWENIGRVAAEFSHLRGQKLFRRLSITGAERIYVKGAAIYISAHYGNWELGASSLYEYGLPIAAVYRRSNNPYIERFINGVRLSHASELLAKGPQSGPKLVRLLKQGMNLGMLVDQKMNEGIAISFFGREAMTAPAVAQLALRYNMPVIPARCIRTGGAHFRAIIYPPMAVPTQGTDEEKTYDMMRSVNRLLEEWIREYPEQWFWIHRRFPKEIY